MARNQKELAAALGMSEGQVSKLKRRGMPTDSVEAARAWRSRNVGGYFRADSPAAAAPAVGTVPGAAPPAAALDLGQERAALARAQRLSVEMRNAVQAGEYAPIQLLARVLATASQAVAEHFDHLPGHLKRTCPRLTDRERAEVIGVINAARNEWIRSTAQLVAADLSSPDDGPDIEDDLVTPSDPENAHEQ